MRYKNIFFVICALLVYFSQIHSMIIASKYSRKPHCDVHMQKRSSVMGSMTGGVIIAATLILIDEKIKSMDTRSIPRSKVIEKTPAFKAIEKIKNGIQITSDEVKKQTDKEFCEKIKTITIMVKKSTDKHKQMQNQSDIYRSKKISSIDRYSENRNDDNRGFDNFSNVLGAAIIAKIAYDARNNDDSTFNIHNDASSADSDTSSLSNDNYS